MFVRRRFPDADCVSVASVAMIVISSAFLLGGNQFKRNIAYYPTFLTVYNLEKIQLLFASLSIIYMSQTESKVVLRGDLCFCLSWSLDSARWCLLQSNSMEIKLFITALLRKAACCKASDGGKDQMT